jgi:predicted regulator of Ras-like GTPase activity (Roadblock/LC7/MglB family)
MASTLDSLKKLDGFLAAALVDSSSGMMIESLVVGSFPIEVAAAANTEVLQAKLKAMDATGLGDETIEDILISLNSQYHLIRPLASNREIFIYVALERARANLALARMEVKKVEGSIKRI